MKVFRRNKKGFTLIEVLVVVAIIAILGAIVTASTVAILRSSRKKAVTSNLTSYWSITVTAFNQINKGYTTSASPSAAFLKTRLNFEPKLGTGDCPKLSENEIYIKYEYNSKSVNQKYTVTAIYIRYKNQYYYTTDGKTVTGPKDAP